MKALLISAVVMVTGVLGIFFLTSYIDEGMPVAKVWAQVVFLAFIPLFFPHIIATAKWQEISDTPGGAIAAAGFSGVLFTAIVHSLTAGDLTIVGQVICALAAVGAVISLCLAGKWAAAYARKNELSKVLVALCVVGPAVGVVLVMFFNLPKA